MEKSKIYVALCYTVFAVGAAFAAALKVQPVSMRSYLSSSPKTLRCLITGKTCDDAGVLACSVYVTVQTGTDVASSNPSATNKVYRDVTMVYNYPGKHIRRHPS
jgi:hypothetical protein